MVDIRPVNPSPSRALDSHRTGTLLASGLLKPLIRANMIHHTLETEGDRTGNWFGAEQKEAGEDGTSTTP